MNLFFSMILAVLLWFLIPEAVESVPSRSYNTLGCGKAMRPCISFKDLLLIYKNKAPFLYSKHRFDPNVEHVVPVSVLKKYVQEDELHFAINDPYNMCLANSAMNSKRSNYRFLFPYKINKGKISSFEPVGTECYISHKERLFVPRKEDCSLIASCVIYCHRKYGVPFEETVCSENILAREWCTRKGEREKKVHKILADFYMLMWSVDVLKRQ
jgi:hypothetical protein